jgi:hypothetical protein
VIAWDETEVATKDVRQSGDAIVELAPGAASRTIVEREIVRRLVDAREEAVS